MSVWIKIVRAGVAALGAIAVAALGEGVWELVLKPFFPRGLKILVDLSTFGIKGLEDPIYKDIAMGPYERGSIYTFLFILETMLVLLPVSVYAAWRRIRLAERLLETSKDQSQDLQLKRGEDLQNAVNLARNVTKFVAVCTPIILLILTFNLFSVLYEVRSEARLRQLIQIDSAFLSDNQLKKYRSDAARIASKEDFEGLISSLVDVARKNRIDPPL